MARRHASGDAPAARAPRRAGHEGARGLTGTPDCRYPAHSAAREIRHRARVTVLLGDAPGDDRLTFRRHDERSSAIAPPAAEQAAEREPDGIRSLAHRPRRALELRAHGTSTPPRLARRSAASRCWGSAVERLVVQEQRVDLPAWRLSSARARPAAPKLRARPAVPVDPEEPRAQRVVDRRADRDRFAARSGRTAAHEDGSRRSTSRLGRSVVQAVEPRRPGAGRRAGAGAGRA